MPVQRQQPKVKRFRVYNGVTLNQQVLSGIDSERHRVQLEVNSLGIIVHQVTPFGPKLIPWANILECDLVEETLPQPHLVKSAV
jgi:hypothetical protein